MRLLGILTLGLAILSTGYSQTTFATITGIVTDPQGTAVPGAEVVATHLRSNYQYRAKSNYSGNYTLAQLLEGAYILRVEAAGFKAAEARDIELVAQDLRRIDVTLQIGVIETKVEVSTGAALIETETARISDSRSTRELNTLPLNTRGLWNYLGLTPGIEQAGNGSSTRRFAGSRANQSDASIDGISSSNLNDGTQISPLVDFSESFQEMRVDMANNTAEFGSIGQVTIISKSGSNDIHGSAFDYYVSPVFRARNPFAAARGTGVRHTPGGSVGGPVYLPHVYNGKNRSFFFFSIENSRGSAIQDLLNPTVPLASWRAGDFSALAPGTVVRDPFGNNSPFPNNTIPTARLNPVALKIQDRFYPLPNFGSSTVLQSQNYREQKTRPFDPETTYSIRGDHRFSEKSFLFGRWTWNRSFGRGYEDNLPTIGQLEQSRDTRNLVMSHTQTIRPNVINEFRWGRTFNNQPRNGAVQGKQLVKDLGLVGLVDNLPDINGIFNVSFTGLGIQGLTQTAWRHPGFENLIYQFQDHVSWFRGRHNAKAGVLVTRVDLLDDQMSDALFGQVTFSNRFTGFPYADFLLGIPTTAARAYPSILYDRRRWSYDFFVTDDFKVTPRLSLNLGVRYELHPAWSELEGGRQAIFDVSSSKIVIPDGSLSKVSPLLPAGYVDVIEAHNAGLPGSTLLKTDRNNFAPRFGIAWRPFGNNTVLRAGWGIFYDIVSPNASAGGSPFVINEPTFTNPANAPTVILPLVFPTSGGGPTTIGLPSAIRSDLRMPYSMQYNVTIEHQRWNTGFRISYIGTATRQGVWGYNINQPVGDARAFVDKPRLFPNYPAITYLTNGAGHQYNSLTLEMDRHFLNGLSYQLSYVLARDIGDLERNETSEDAYNRARERSVWLDIPTHRVTGNFIYQLPFGKGKRFLGNANRALSAVAGGWEITSVYSLYSGQFLTPTWTGPDPTGTRFTASRTAPTVTIRPNELHDPNLPPEQRTVQRWFDPTAFGAPAVGSFGSSAKGVIKGPGSSILNTGIAKVFAFRERARLRWELTATNVLNHPNWANPALEITSTSQIGVISAVGGPAVLDASGPRSLRMGLRMEW